MTIFNGVERLVHGIRTWLCNSLGHGAHNLHALRDGIRCRRCLRNLTPDETEGS